jgi:dihydroorotate dehydrogenase (fumarate)
VIFNRFYQPDIDIDALDVAPHLELSSSSELRLRLRWLAILSSQLRTSLAITGGIHTGVDAIKAIMAGADAVQMVSALLRRGPEHIRTVREEMVHWMEDHGYESLHQMRGSMNLARCPNPAAFERSNYIRTLQEWRG